MFLSDLIRRLFSDGIAGDRRPTQTGLFAPVEMRRILARERERADRTAGRFSLVVFSVPSRRHDWDTLVELVRLLQRRLRWTDEAGWLDGRRIGVLLPSTPPQGAWTVADDICLAFSSRVPLPACHVYVYPVRAPQAAVAQAAVAHNDKALPQESDDDAVPAETPARAMESLFLNPMPVWKRMIDIAGALAGLTLLSPLYAAAAIAVRLTSPGPVLFMQWRDGLGGKPFAMYKFRSMVIDAERQQETLLSMNEQQGPVFKIRNDPRITPVGRLLRKTSIDELPQLWNVLKGEMSLVGPRPPLHKEVCAYDGWQRHRLDVTPGLTCLWQVSGRSQIPFTEWMRMDLRYIRARSVRRDVALLLRTVPAVLFRRGAS